MNVVDLFCGCGGLSKGFEDAGFNVVLGVDNDEPALETFRKNHQNSMAINLDLFNENAIKLIKDKLLGREADVIVGGPPCQGFSLTGTRNFDDDRNRLYLAMIRIVNELQPKAFVIENVPGMATLYGGTVKNEIISRFTQMGYSVKAQILCAADYGVPQMRKRLVFIGIKGKDVEVKFPKPMLSPDAYITCEDALSDLPSLDKNIGEEIQEYFQSPKTEYQEKMRAFSDHLYNHVGTRHTKEVKEIISMVPDGGNYKDLPEGVGESRKFNEAWTRYNSKKPSKTIDTGHRNHFHYKYNRVPTVRENARLQSFRDDFVFCGTKTQQYRQVGNAVPPILGYQIASQIIMQIEGSSNED